MRFFCKHDFEIIKEYEIKSVMEKLIENGLSSLERGSLSMMQSKLVIVYKCKKCKKIKESIIKNI